MLFKPPKCHLVYSPPAMDRLDQANGGDDL